MHNIFTDSFKFPGIRLLKCVSSGVEVLKVSNGNWFIFVSLFSEEPEQLVH